jgi:hypothetical protein
MTFALTSVTSSGSSIEPGFRLAGAGQREGPIVYAFRMIEYHVPRDLTELLKARIARGSPIPPGIPLTSRQSDHRIEAARSKQVTP